MKSAILISAFVAFGSAAFATPAVGDYTQWKGTMDGSPVTLETRLTAFDGKLWTQESVITLQGQAPAKNVDQVSPQSLLTDSGIAWLLIPANCASQSGVLEAVTVPAGTFATCKITNDGMSWNVGQVPFGMIRGRGGESNMDISLVKFTNGTGH